MGDYDFLVLYATETGNPLDASERIVREGRRRRFIPRLASIDEYPVVSIINANTWSASTTKFTRKTLFQKIS